MAQMIFGGMGFLQSNSDVLLRQLAKIKNNPDVIKAVEGDPQYQQKIALQNRAYQHSSSRTSLWSIQGYPIIFDITGRNLSLVHNIKDKMESFGYDVYMVFVSTSLETALQRNLGRMHKPGLHVADEDFVKDAWNAADKNKEEFRRIFGQNFWDVSNYQDVSGYDKSSMNNLYMSLHRRARNFLGLEKIVFNPVGRKFLAQKQSKIVENIRYIDPSTGKGWRSYNFENQVKAIVDEEVKKGIQ